MKILFVTSSGIEDKPFGGAQGSIRNYSLLKEWGDVIVYNVQKKSKFSNILSVLERNCPPMTNKHKRELDYILDTNVIDLVVFDMSIYGKLIDSVIKRKIKSVVFYANCEFDYVKVQFFNKSFKRYLMSKAVYRNERYISQNADYLIALSKRDAKRIHSLYNCTCDKIIPLSLKDKFKNVNHVDTIDYYCLLFGAKVPANIQGYEWFIKNVSPYLHCKTYVAGSGFESYRTLWNTDKVKVIGYVDDLEALYDNALCVAIPIFYGAGMKVKTVEALMFGKNIFGTEEAFSGYELDYQKIGGMCNTSDEFISQINNLVDNHKSSFNLCSRETYLAKYSYEQTKKLFDEALQEIIYDNN